MKKLMALMTSLMLLVAMAAFAAQETSQKTMGAKEHKGKGEVTRQATGTISSTEGDKLVLNHKVNGKEEPITFVMNDQTKKEGELRSGEKATVHYKMESGQNVATMVKASVASSSSSSTHQKKH